MILTEGHIILEVYPQAAFGPCLKTLLGILSKILSKMFKIAFFQISSKYSDPSVKVTQGHILLKVSPQANIWPTFITAINSVRDIANVKVCYGRTDEGGSLHRLALFTHVSQKKLKKI